MPAVRRAVRAEIRLGRETEVRIAPRTLDHSYLLGLIMEHAPVGVAVLTTDLRYVLVGRVTCEQMIGAPQEAVVGRHCYDLVGQYRDDVSRAGLERACDGCPSLRAVTTGESASAVRNVREGLVAHTRAVPLTDESGEVIGVLEVVENIADKVIDPLTEVHNYRYYEEMITQEGYRAVRYEAPLSLLALDLDHFKDLNDRYGHLEGDQVLYAVAQRLRATVRTSDHLCRIGGDEFAVLAPHTTFQQARALARRIEEAIAQGFAEFGLYIAVGVASFPKDTTDPLRLREIADRRLYRAKTQPRGFAPAGSPETSPPRPRAA